MMRERNAERIGNILIEVIYHHQSHHNIHQIITIINHKNLIKKINLDNNCNIINKTVAATYKMEVLHAQRHSHIIIKIILNLCKVHCGRIVISTMRT